MKNILKLMLLPAMILPIVLTSCDEDRDSNPTLDLSHVSEGFTLNTPAYATNNTYDLVNSESITLTCEQPNYGGVPYAVRYYVQVAIESSFETYTELSTSYTSASMSVDASELNAAVVEMYQTANPDVESVPETMAIYIRLRAVIDALNDLYDENPSETYSNIITLPSVHAEYQTADAEFPTVLYVCGSSIQTAWSSWKEMPQVYGIEGSYYTMIYAPDGGAFKWGTYEQEWLGYSDFASVNDGASAGLSEDGDGNIAITNGGWYVINIEGTLSANGKEITYALNVYSGSAYVIGAIEGGSWTDSDASWALTAPSDASSYWVSPAFAAAGELRAYIKVGSYDWWRTEFTIYSGSLYWRTVDIPSNWSEDVGSDYSVQCTAGQKLYVNFDTNTGYVE